MPNFKSLTAKFLLISVLFVSFVIILAGSSILFTRHIKGESMRINHAGKMRYQHFEATLLAHRALEAKQPALRKALVRESRDYVLSIDRIMSDLINGNTELNIKPLSHYKESLTAFNSLADEWNKDLKPLLLRILELRGPETEALLDDYTNKVDEHVYRMDSYLEALTAHHEKEIKEFYRFRIYALIFFVFASFFVFVFMRRTILAPVQKLKDAALEIRKGNFKVRTEINNSDEIGELSKNFNQMSQTIEILVDEKTAHLKELAVLNSISAAANQTLAIEILLEEVMDEILHLEPLKLEKKGAIFLYDEKSKTLRLSVSRNFSNEQITTCGFISEGECLCGIAAEQRELLISQSNTEDERHTKIYSGIKEHGHIILPLKSKDKLYGVLCLYFSAGVELSAKEIELYKSIADIISVSIQNAINHRQVAMLAQSLDSSTDLIIITDLKGVIIHANPQAWNQLGYTQKDIEGSNVSIIQSRNNPAGLGEEIFSETLKGGWEGEVINVRSDGSEYYSYLTTSPVKDENGGIIALIGISRDVTGRRQAEVALKHSEEKFRMLFDLLNDGIFIVDTKGNFVELNTTAHNRLGYAKEDMLTMNVRDIDTPEFAAKVPERLEAVQKYGYAIFETAHVRRDGTVMPVEINSRFINYQGRKVLFSVVRDITERKRTEDTLRKYELIVSSSIDHMSFIDKNFIYQAVNDMYLMSWNKRREEIVGHHISELLGHEKFEKMARPNLERCLSGETIHYQAWFELPASGRRFMDVAYTPYFSKEKTVEGIVVNSRDITVMKQAENELNLLQSLSLYVSEAEDFRSALKKAIEKICEATGWVFAEVWVPNREGTALEFGDIWHSTSKKAEMFGDFSRKKSFKSGEGLPGRVMATRKPEWVMDVSVDGEIFPRAEGAMWAGLKSGFGIPILTGEKVLAVLCFFMSEHHKEDERLINLISAISVQLGAVFQRKLAEDALKKSEVSLREAQKIANLGNWEWDIQKNEAYCSEEMDNIFGYQPGEFGRTFEALIKTVHPDDRELVERSMQEAMHGIRPLNIDRRAVLPDGSVRVVHEDGKVVFDETGKPLRMVGTTQDITERKRAEELLKKYNEELEAQVKERTQGLEQARLQAEAANRAKSEFLSNMSHELRTPLNSVIGFTQLLQDDVLGPLSAQQLDAVNDINTSGRHLLSLINDILDIAKVESGKMELEPGRVEIKGLLHASLSMIKEKAMKHGIKLEMEVGPEADIEIEADERKLKQIMFNLLSNAVKFTPDGGSVRVSARRVKGQAAGVA